MKKKSFEKASIYPTAKIAYPKKILIGYFLLGKVAGLQHHYNQMIGCPISHFYLNLPRDLEGKKFSNST